MFILQQNNKKLITKCQEVKSKVPVKYFEENSVLASAPGPRGSLLLESIHSSGSGGGERLFEYDC